MSIPLSVSYSDPFARTGLGAGSRSAPGKLTEEVRAQLMSELHMGTLGPGDRLPSIRQLARERGVDHRAVAQAYRDLESEGLVEIRGRSGVRVARPVRKETRDRESEREQASWLAGVLAESWLHAVGPSELRQLLESCCAASRLRCACVESNHDQMLAYCTEIGTLSEMRMVPVYVAPFAAGEEARLKEALATVDLVVTTPYHAGTVRAALAEGGPPLVVLRINPELAEAVRTRIREHGLTVVAVTPEFGERMRLMYGDVIHFPDQLRVVLADDDAGMAALDPAEPVLLTRAARSRLPALRQPTLVFPHSPTIAPDSVRELTESIVRLNLRRQAAAD